MVFLFFLSCIQVSLSLWLVPLFPDTICPPLSLICLNWGLPLFSPLLFLTSFSADAWRSFHTPLSSFPRLSTFSQLEYCSSFSWQSRAFPQGKSGLLRILGKKNVLSPPSKFVKSTATLPPNFFCSFFFFFFGGWVVFKDTIKSPCLFFSARIWKEFPLSSAPAGAFGHDSFELLDLPTTPSLDTTDKFFFSSPVRVNFFFSPFLPFSTPPPTEVP